MTEIIDKGTYSTSLPPECLACAKFKQVVKEELANPTLPGVKPRIMQCQPALKQGVIPDLKLPARELATVWVNQKKMALTQKDAIIDIPVTITKILGSCPHKFGILTPENIPNPLA
jgi:hypothetical protein